MKLSLLTYIIKSIYFNHNIIELENVTKYLEIHLLLILRKNILMGSQILIANLKTRSAPHLMTPIKHGQHEEINSLKMRQEFE